MARIVFQNVTKVFMDRVTALDNFSLSVADGELFVLVGPSGCGKSTALRLVAGLEHPTAGAILADGKPLNDLTPQERNVAVVFQNYALYPHKTVRQNLDFPLKMMKLARPERRRRIEEAAALLGLRPLLNRRPRELSGGQQQRVAMGRAIVRQPIAFLMDEPLSNLDAKLRVDIRAQIAALQHRLGITTIYVTHDQVEALTLGDRVGVLQGGRLQQAARPKEIYDRPANVFVATFMGSPRMNVFRAVLEKTGRGELLLRSGHHGWPLPASCRRAGSLAEHIGRELLAGLRPEAFEQAAREPQPPSLEGTIRAREALGHEHIAYLDCSLELLSDASLARLRHGEDQAAPHVGDPDQPPPLIVRIPAGEAPDPGGRLSLRPHFEQLHLFGPDGEALPPG